MKPNSDKTPKGEKDSRLNSWKQIAAYLNRDVRTAHRWEKHEGLPVYRHLHRKRGTVYAYPAEIDAWIRQRSSAESGELLTVHRPRLMLGVAAVALALISGAAAVLVYFEPGPNAPETSVSLLIASTVNRTTEDRFNGVVDAYLQSELGSQQTQIIPPSRIIETLALMREPAGSDLNIALMLEVAARIPDADLIVTSTLDRFGSEYGLTVQILHPESGTVLEAVRSQASVEDEIPSALTSLVSGTRTVVNTIDIPERDVHLGFEPVTTASLRAAELYWDASLLMFNNPVQMPGAEEQLRQAVAIDAQFATAYIQLAHAIHEQGRPESGWTQFAERALSLADSVSEAERLFILGSYHKLHGNLEEAQAQFLAINSSYPDHFWGQVHMAELSHARNNLEGAAWSMALAADLKPKSIEFQYNAFNFILTTPHPWTLERIHERLLEINSPSNNGGVHPFMPAEFYKVNQLLMAGEARGALAEARDMRRKLDGFPDDVWTRRSNYAARLAEVFIALGRLQEAEQLLQILRDDDADEIRNTPLRRLLNEQRLLSLMAVSRNQNCCEGFEPGPVQLPENALLRIRSGQTEFDAANISDLFQADNLISWILRGELLLQNGDVNRAIELLSMALETESTRLGNLGLAAGLATPTRAEILLAADSLTGALIELQRIDEAIHVLERWSGEQAKVGAFMSSPAYVPYWARLRWRLQTLYEEAGRSEDADSIGSYLESLLALADDDRVIAQSLRDQ